MTSIFRRIRITENIYNTKEKYDLQSKSFINDEYSIKFAENKKHLIKLILLDENLSKRQAISTTHKTTGELVFKSIICSFYDKDLNLLPQYINEVVGLLCGDGLYIYNCNDPSKSILSKELFINKYSNENESKLDLSNMNEEDKQYGMSVNSYIDLDRIDKFNKLVEKNNINVVDIVEFDEEGYEQSSPKNDLLDDYENSVINQYRITKWIKTPTITAGISQNQRYFDIQFHFCLSGSVNCAENLQMWWRERRTNCKEIYFCFNEPIRPYRKLYNTDYIHNQLKNNYSGANSNTKLRVDITEYKYSDNPQFRNLLAINLTNRQNSQANYPQEFIKYLIKHTFTLYDPQTDTGNIHILKDNLKDDTELDKDQKDLLEEQFNKGIANFKHTDIKNISNEDITIIKQRREKQLPISIMYKSIYSKYKALNSFKRFKSLTIYYWIKNKLKNYIRIIKGTEKTPETDNLISLLTDTEYMDMISNIYYNKYLIEINNEDFIKTYSLHEYKSVFNDNYKQLKDIIKHRNNVANPPLIPEEIKIEKEAEKRQTIIVSTLLEFLRIDIENFDNKEIIRYQLESDYDKNRLTGFKNEILSNNNTQTEEGVEVGFIDWINTILLPHYRDTTNISITSLSALDYKQILKLIKIYIGKVNLQIDYGDNHSNQSKLYKNQQFSIIQKHTSPDPPTTIRVGYQSILPDLTINKEQYYNKLWGTDRELLEQRIDNTIIDFDRPIERIDYVKIKKDIIVEKVVCNEAKINDTLLTINSTEIKRTADRKSYKIKDKLLHTEKYIGYDPTYSDNKVNTRNNNTLYTKPIEGTDPEERRVLVGEEHNDYNFCDNVCLDIIDSCLDNMFGKTINQQYEVESYKKKNKFKYTDKQYYNSDKKNFVLDQIKRKKKENKKSIIDYGENNYEEVLGDKFTELKSDIELTDIYKKCIVAPNNLELPQIIIDENDFMYKVIGELYKVKYLTELSRETYDNGYEVKYQESYEPDEYSDNEEEEEEEVIVNKPKEKVVFKTPDEAKLKLMGW